VIGREAELGRIRRALDQLSHGGAALHVVGEPGVGKSELLDAAVGEATERGLRVLRARGAASESHLTFAALHDLVRPILDRADSLPTRHRTALLSAFGLLESAGSPERLFVALGALELVADASAEVPVLIAVDDLPWTDAASPDGSRRSSATSPSMPGHAGARTSCPRAP
jgi:predicted ATPase